MPRTTSEGMGNRLRRWKRARVPAPSPTRRSPNHRPLRARVHWDLRSKGPGPSLKGIPSEETPEPPVRGTSRTTQSPPLLFLPCRQLAAGSHPKPTAPKSVAADPATAMLASGCSGRRGAELREPHPIGTSATRGRDRGGDRGQSRALLQTSRRGGRVPLGASLGSKRKSPSRGGAAVGALGFRRCWNEVPRFLVEHTSSPSIKSATSAVPKY